MGFSSNQFKSQRFSSSSLNTHWRRGEGGKITISRTAATAAAAMVFFFQPRQLIAVCEQDKNRHLSPTSLCCFFFYLFFSWLVKKTNVKWLPSTFFFVEGILDSSSFFLNSFTPLVGPNWICILIFIDLNPVNEEKKKEAFPFSCKLKKLKS